MVTSIVRGYVLKWIPWQCITAVIIYGLECRASEKTHALTCRESNELVGKTGSNSVENKALYWVIVEGTVGIRYIQTMVTRVECC